MTDHPDTVARKVNRSAITGRFVDAKRAEKHPHTTVTETIEYPDREIPDPPPDPFTLKVEIDCAVIDDRLNVYDAWNPTNGQGPRQAEQLEVRDDGEGSFLRFNSCPMVDGFDVWNSRDKKMVTFPAGSYASAGAQIDGGTITYGAVEVDCRATQASDGTRIAVLLWPDGPPPWPSREVDFAEVSGDGEDRGRQRIGMNSHYIDHHDGQHKQHQLTYEVDWLTWRTVRVEWTPGVLAWLIDGTEVGRITEDDAPAATDSPPVHIAPDLGTNGKNWTAPNGPGG